MTKFLVLFALGMLGLILFSFLPEHMIAVLSSEEGWVEMSSAVALLITGILLLLMRSLWAWAHVALLALLLSEREMESEALAAGPLQDAIAWIDQVFMKTTAVQIVLGLWLIVGFIRFTWPMLRDNARTYSDILLTIGLAVLFAVIAQALDKGIFADETTPFAGTTLQVWEELLEFYFALFLLVAAAMGLYRNTALNRA